MMSLYERANTRVKVDSESSVEIKDNVGMDQGSVLSSFCVFVDVTVFSKLLYADDLVLMIEMIEGL